MIVDGEASRSDRAGVPTMWNRHHRHHCVLTSKEVPSYSLRALGVRVEPRCPGRSPGPLTAASAA